jgi:hypothetical protein
MLIKNGAMKRAEYFSLTGVAPCDNCKFNRPDYPFCRLFRTACTEFKAYTTGWKIKYYNRTPSRKVYNDIFTDIVGFIPERHEPNRGQ